MKNIYPWQENDWTRLQELRKRPLHGLLFKGSKGIGKFDLAMNFARSLLCQHPDFCLLQPDVLSLDAEEGDDFKPASGKKPSKQISVDQVRGLADFSGMSAHQGGRGVLFILVSHKPQQLLPTILSRCLSFALPAPDAAEAVRWLAQQGVKTPAEALAASGFSPLQAAQLGEQPGGEERDKLLRAVRQPATLDVFALAEALQKTEQVVVVQWLQQWSYDLSSMKLAGRLRYHPGEEAAVRKLVEPIAPLNLARLQNLLKTAKREAQHTLNSKLFMELSVCCA